MSTLSALLTGNMDSINRSIQRRSPRLQRPRDCSTLPGRHEVCNTNCMHIPYGDGARRLRASVVAIYVTHCQFIDNGDEDQEYWYNKDTYYCSTYWWQLLRKSLVRGMYHTPICPTIKVKTQYVHCRLIRSYLLFPWRKPEEISR